MKQYRLSSPGERIAGISFSILISICFIVLMIVLRNNTPLLICCGLCVLLLVPMLGFYVANVLRTVCTIDLETKQLEVRGFPSYTKDLSKAVRVETVGKSSNQSTVRALVFTDAEENVIAVVPTLFTYRQGVLAEPLAIQISKDMGIGYKENIPAWYYDKQKLKEHLAEEAAQEKAESKKRRAAFMKKLMNPGKRK
jgi:hypothetical protein